MNNNDSDLCEKCQENAVNKEDGIEICDRCLG